MEDDSIEGTEEIEQIITRKIAQGYNSEYKKFHDLNFSQEIKEVLWEYLTIDGDDIRLMLAQKDRDGHICKNIRVYPGMRILDGKPSFTLIFVGVGEDNKNIYRSEITRAARLPLADDILSDEHEPCKPPNNCEPI